MFAHSFLFSFFDAFGLSLFPSLTGSYVALCNNVCLTPSPNSVTFNLLQFFCKGYPQDCCTFDSPLITEARGITEFNTMTSFPISVPEMAFLEISIMKRSICLQPKTFQLRFFFCTPVPFFPPSSSPYFLFDPPGIFVHCSFGPVKIAVNSSYDPLCCSMTIIESSTLLYGVGSIS